MFIGIPIGEFHHLTIAYLGPTGSHNVYARTVLAAARTAQWWTAKGNRPLSLHMGKELGCFTEGKRPVWYVSANAEQLDELRNDILVELSRACVPIVDIFPNYVPHVTLGRGANPPENPYNGLTVGVNRIMVGSSKFTDTFIKL